METLELLAVGDQVIERVRRRSPTAIGECVVRAGVELEGRVRLGDPVSVQERTTRTVGLRVIEGARAGMVSTSDVSPAGLCQLVHDAFDLLQVAEVDPSICSIEPPEAPASDLDLHDPAVAELRAQDLLDRAHAAEAAALAADPRVTGSDGATCRRSRSAIAYLLGDRFRAGYRATSIAVQVTPLAADEGGKKRRASRHTTARHLADLDDLSALGAEAARSTAGRIGARRVETCEAPVVFAPAAARALLGLVAQCVLGSALWRRSSYLFGREGTSVASELVTIVDDAQVPRGPGSRPFDGEGLPSRRNVVIDRGVLVSALCSSPTARRLGRTPTASAVRGASAGISDATSNFFLAPGADTPDAILARTPRGLYVTELTGYGFNAVTGGLSRGAAGFWIDRGALAFPVEGVTISLDLDTLLRRIDAVADDLRLRSSIDAPTFRVSSAVIGGAAAKEPPAC